MSFGGNGVVLLGRENAAAAEVLVGEVERVSVFEASVQYIRIGRRTVEDDHADIPTQFIVVAKVDAARGKFRRQPIESAADLNESTGRVQWLSVATWQLNGLRIGEVEHGDELREEGELDYSIHLSPDPYFFARNIGSPQSIRHHLLKITQDRTVPTHPETLDDQTASRRRQQASWARLNLDTGATTPAARDPVSIAELNMENRFAYPWSLPVSLTKSDMRFLDGYPGFDRGMTRGNELDAINVVAAFVNTIEDRNLRLKHYIQCDFDPDDTVMAIKQYFREGDRRLTGLQNNHYLQGREWSMELWVLPQLEGCSTLFKWDTVPELKAKGWCNAASIEGANGTGKLYVEVRIVAGPEGYMLGRW